MWMLPKCGEKTVNSSTKSQSDSLEKRWVYPHLEWFKPLTILCRSTSKPVYNHIYFNQTLSLVIKLTQLVVRRKSALPNIY